MKRGALPAFVWVLGGLLALGWLALALGRAEGAAMPSADSRAPSGLAAFAELLRREGYRVRIDRLAKPKLAPDEVAICALVEDAPSGGAAEDHIAQGGRVLLLPFTPQFDEASRSAAGTAAWKNDAEDELRTSVMGSHLDLAHNEVGLPQADAWAVWWNDEEDAAVLYRYGNGVAAELADGIVATNRFLDQRDNAALLLNVFRWLAPPGSRVVFVEASIGLGRDPGLLAVIGPWAQALGWQAVVLFLVVVWTLGQRFGLPEAARTRQRGARELVDAIGQIYARSRATGLALEAAAANADARLRRHLKLPRDATREARNRAIPEPLAAALDAVERAADLRPSARQALPLVRTLDRELDALLGPAHSRSGQRFRR